MIKQENDFIKQQHEQAMNKNIVYSRKDFVYKDNDVNNKDK